MVASGLNEKQSNKTKEELEKNPTKEQADASLLKCWNPVRGEMEPGQDSVDIFLRHAPEVQEVSCRTDKLHSIRCRPESRPRVESNGEQAWYDKRHAAHESETCTRRARANVPIPQNSMQVSQLKHAHHRRKGAQ